MAQLHDKQHVNKTTAVGIQTYDMLSPLMFLSLIVHKTFSYVVLVFVSMERGGINEISVY